MRERGRRRKDMMLTSCDTFQLEPCVRGSGFNCSSLLLCLCSCLHSDASARPGNEIIWRTDDPYNHKRGQGYSLAVELPLTSIAILKVFRGPMGGVGKMLELDKDAGDAPDWRSSTKTWRRWIATCGMVSTRLSPMIRILRNTRLPRPSPPSPRAFRCHI